MNWGIKLLQSSALPLGYGAVLYIMKGKIKLCLTNDIIAWHYQNVKHYFKLKFQNYTVKSARLSRILPILVPLVGVEPTRSCPRRILSPLRLPISPQRHNQTTDNSISYF